MTTEWQPLAVAMTEKLISTGELTDPAWQRAFTDTPRHVFVPDHSVADAYSLTAIVTQWRTADELGNKRPTSSASAPGAVAVMLELLAVQDHHRVLEIGTGTGYNAALVCHRLGAANVYSNDLDPALIDQARRALDNLGYHPTLVATEWLHRSGRQRPLRSHLGHLRDHPHPTRLDTTTRRWWSYRRPPRR